MTGNSTSVRSHGHADRPPGDPRYDAARGAARRQRIRADGGSGRGRSRCRSPGAPVVTLGIVLACLGATLLIGATHKAPCVGSDWGDGRQYRLECYTDIVPLFTTEQLAEGRLPYLDACTPAATNCDEYPVLTMYLMRVTAWVAGGHTALLLGQRAPPLDLRGRDRRVPLRARCATRALVRPRADPRPAGVRELGPARRRPRDGERWRSIVEETGGPARSPGSARRPSCRRRCSSCRSPRNGSARDSRTVRSRCGGRERRRGSR